MRQLARCLTHRPLWLDRLRQLATREPPAVDLQAQEALKQANARLTVALSAVRASVWAYDARRGTLEWDPRGAELYGHDLNGDPQAWENSLASDHAADVVQRWRSYLADPACDTFDMEYAIQHPRLGVRQIRCVGRNERDANGQLVQAIGLDLDVTEERSTAQRAEEMANRLQLAVTASGLGIWTVDVLTGTTEWNEALYRLYGEDPARFRPTPTTWEDRLHPDDRDRVRAMAARTLSGEPVDVDEHRILRADGEVRTVRMMLRHLRTPRGRTLRVVGATFDVTEQHRATEAIDRARAAAEEANRLKSEFLANMSHEIRTPMNAIIGMTELALQGELPAREQQHVAKANAAARNLLGVLNDILDFSKIEAGKLAVEQARFSLHEVLERVADVVALQAGEKGLELVFDLPVSLPCELLGDPHRLAQVLVNLIANAIKFTPSGRVVVRASICQDDDGTHPRLRFEVEDTGIGLDPAQQQRLFQPFSQADTSITRRFGGTGLGLVICRRLLELMGGTIGVRSTPGGGSTFWFDLPAARLEPPPPPLVAPRASAGWTVLVVDDDPVARDALTRLVQGLGHRALAAASADEARALWRQGAGVGTGPLVLLIDAGLQQRAGLELASEGARSAPPVRVLLTYRPHEYATLRREVAALAVQASLPKPVLPLRLHEALDAPAPRSGTAPGRLPGPALHGMKVLLAEDNPLNRELAIELLRRAGVQLQTVESGAEAIEAVQREAFDAVLMDLQMPGMDGYEATRRIRALGGPFAFLPIIAMTAHAMAGDRERSLAAGMDDHLAKPIDTAMLLRTLHRWGGPRREADLTTGAMRWSETIEAGPQVLDVDAGVRGCGDSPAVFQRALQRFVELYEDDAVAPSQEPSAQHIAAHSLKGVAGSLGMRALYELALHADLSCRGGAALQPAECERLNAALQQAREAARGYLMARGAAPGGLSSPR
ncbi:signal transduction histidine kinase [Caldimonas brevitalea]|uniref:Sensory/regulatory protein RpfC n=1 Tax=Caldimonas brevitalea TaxID=413882 RepID=A0A0G3BHX1_9BURK|nr:signal transduction histidine kinase [Caldimonas brevitalea]